MSVRPQNIAMIEVGHVHTGLIAEGLKRQSGRIVAVSDKNERIARHWAETLGCRAYSDYRLLLEAEHVDFAFAFGEHFEMPSIAESLIAFGIPFSIEKPLGVSAADVGEVLRIATERRAFVSIPFVFRVSPLCEMLETLRAEGRIGPPEHMTFIDLAGSPQRYSEMSPWILDPARAGGGCFINLSVHFIDLFIRLTGQEPKLAGCRYSNSVHGLPIEDHAVVLLGNESGGSCAIEVGYVFPDDKRRFQSYSVVGQDWFAHISDNTMILSRNGEQDRFSLNTDTGRYYATYVERTLEALAEGRPPVAGPDDLAKVMRVVDRANALGRQQLPQVNS